MAAFYIILRTLFTFLLAEGVLESSPLRAIKPPISRSDQIQPFAQTQGAEGGVTEAE